MDLSNDGWRKSMSAAATATTVSRSKTSAGRKPYAKPKSRMAPS